MTDKLLPNILITGTPGTGKSTLSTLLCHQLNQSLQSLPLQFTHIELSKTINQLKLYKEWDYELNCSVFDDDMVNDYLEPLMAKGGIIIDFHSSDFFPERFFDFVFILRTDNTILYDRLTARGYPESKVQLNVECEILETCKCEAEESYRSEIVFEFYNNVEGDMNSILEKCFNIFKERGTFNGLISSQY